MNYDITVNFTMVKILDAVKKKKKVLIFEKKNLKYCQWALLMGHGLHWTEFP